MVRQENLSAKIEQVERYLKLIEPFIREFIGKMRDN